MGAATGRAGTSRHVTENDMNVDLCTYVSVIAVGGQDCEVGQMHNPDTARAVVTDALAAVLSSGPDVAGRPVGGHAIDAGADLSG